MELMRYLDKFKVKYEVSDYAPNTFIDLYQHSSKLIKVWSGASENTIWDDPNANYAFRAWHDSIHLAYKLDFTLKGELAVNDIQAELAARLVGDNFAKLIIAEVKGQVEYFSLHGEFPKRSKEVYTRIYGDYMRTLNGYSDLSPWDMDNNSLVKEKLQLGLIKIKKIKPVNPLAPYKQMKRNPDLFKRGEKCTFNADTCEAYSYSWWRFVEKVGKFVVFNDYRYSVTTTRHQCDTERLMYKIGIKIDFRIQARKGLQDYQTAIEDYNYRIKQLKEEIKKPRTHKAKNEMRLLEIKGVKEKIKLVKSLQTIKNKAKVYA